ncbi:DsbA family oxidoreductase [Pedobacter heparinus]|uniref:DSBA oxidoreductase n=1 Tax=Pedobacter heparinus (strain ATCC 13125 / DSM 2366 / CIP 104194 / JCM 7457 / NBRC 12017 / NCIMB 9290 / NRRL B-14731 / HIM 762-3) TaxID=485917 RepID=C6XXS2_PEDHD|nr:DsbA family oxidoreductase [Pedobacter heparinus]ACU04340.1 DSBA oxidoreductase [Pedobacter heparinus DSM 2366]
MKVDIWSDVRCPFCYIGKRKFEMALAKFEHRNEVVVEWHSFELDPNAETLLNVDAYDYLADRYDRNREWAIERHRALEESAAEVGLTFNFDKAVMANSFDAHRLIQMAKVNDTPGDIEELLFKAHFTDGKNIADQQVLIGIGKEGGLDGLAVEMMLKSDDFTDDVRHDEKIAQQIRIKGVPFFVIDQKLSISGAQAPEVFLDVMTKVKNGVED